MSPTPRSGILDIAPYEGGKSTLAGFDSVIKLASNEGALGPSPRAVAAYRAVGETMHRYPDGHATALREALGKRFALDPQRIVCGAGSDELLHLIVWAYAGPGDEVIHSAHGFLMYSIATKAAGATPVIVPDIELTASVDNILEAVTDRTRIVFLDNPNNPTGTYLPVSELRRLRAGLPAKVILVIDAAYAEYVGRNDYSPGAEMVDEGDNVIMTRTFSKIFGMGGMRLGWGYCPAAIADVLNRIRGPFNVSAAALAAGVAAVEDLSFTALAREHNDYWLPWLSAELVRLGLSVTPSVGNFVLVRFPDERGRDAASADAFLRGHGIIVRPMASYGLPHSVRVTVGKDDEMKALIKALTEFLGA